MRLNSKPPAQQVVQDIVDLHRSSAAIYTHNVPGARDYFRTAGECALQGAMPPLSPALAREMQANPRLGRNLLWSSQMSAQLRLWQSHRIAYAVDPTLWAELGDTDDGDTIPGGLLDYLPHSDPFIVLPEPLVIDHGKLLQKVVAVLLTGRTRQPIPAGATIQAGSGRSRPAPEHLQIETPCSTHHPGAPWSVCRSPGCCSATTAGPSRPVPGCAT